MAIIVVLAAVAIPTFGKQLETARESADMEVIRSVYSEILTAATLDSMDGKLDGKNNNVGILTTGTGKNAVKGAYEGITGAPDTGSSNYVYTATLASLSPVQKITQSQPGWQFIQGTVGGVNAPEISSGQATLKYTFSLAPDLKLVSITS